MATIFDVKRFRNPQFTTFDGNHEIKTSLRISDVAPLDVIPVYEGDEFNLNYSIQAKFKPLIAPAFQRIALKQWNHYVRNQDLWDDFNEFFTGVNPKQGQTAYTSADKSLIHPFVKAVKATQVGTSYIGIRPNLSGIDLSDVQIIRTNEDSKWQLIIPKSVLDAVYAQFTAMPRYERFQSVYEDGSIVNTIFSRDLSLHLDDDSSIPLLTRLRPLSEANFPELASAVVGENFIFQVSDSDTNLNSDGSIPLNSTLNITDLFKYSKFRGFRALFEHGFLGDYLGYPSNDFSLYYSSGRFEEDTKKHFSSLTLEEFNELSDSTKLVLKILHNYCFPINDILGYTNTDENLLYNGCPDFPRLNDDFSDFYFKFFSGLTGSGLPNYSDSIDILAYYIAWMKFNNKNTTMLSDCPYFAIVPLKYLVKCSEQPIDSLRFRGYHKIINDYFRDVNLTAEIPIPYRDGGNDIENYYNAVTTFLDNSIASDNILRDWWRVDLLRNKKFSPFFDTDLDISFVIDNDLIRKYVYQLKTWDTLTYPFKHLRDRDYLTGLLPNSSVVDVVAPIMSNTQVQQAYENSGKNRPFTNTSISVDDDNNLVHNNSDIDPYKAGSDAGASPSPIGWLDIENLRITQKLKNYFVKLRYALNGIKDFSKVFFNVDVSDLEVGRAQFLSGNMQLVTISEIVQSASTEISALGSLGGRANSFGNTDFINKQVRYTGFLISTICLSPLENLIGGLDRQMIRQERFDYFLPDFAELGDQSVNKIEANVMPVFFNVKEPNYKDVLGYTMRYMEYKYIASKVHADFLSQKADWHLDIIQPPINMNDVELSQEFLEEKTDDNRIFTDTFDDEMNCDLWVMCNCTYRRALPAINYSEIIS